MNKYYFAIEEVTYYYNEWFKGLWNISYWSPGQLFPQWFTILKWVYKNVKMYIHEYLFLWVGYVDMLSGS